MKAAMKLIKIKKITIHWKISKTECNIQNFVGLEQNNRNNVNNMLRFGRKCHDYRVDCLKVRISNFKFVVNLFGDVYRNVIDWFQRIQPNNGFMNRSLTLYTGMY